MGVCRYCGQNAGFLRKQHAQCRDQRRAGMEEMVKLVAQSAGTDNFNETALRQTLNAIAARAYAGEDEINAAMAAGWARGISHAMADGILTRDEETRLREFRDRMALEGNSQTAEGEATLNRTATDRLTLDARLAALATDQGDAHLQDLSRSLQDAGLADAHRRQPLCEPGRRGGGPLDDGIFHSGKRKRPWQVSQSLGLLPKVNRIRGHPAGPGRRHPRRCPRYHPQVRALGQSALHL